MGAAFAVAAIGWAAVSTLAVRTRLLPDTNLAVYSVALVPLFLLFSGFTFFLGEPSSAQCSGGGAGKSDGMKEGTTFIVLAASVSPWSEHRAGLRD
jgi:hypothetical protein